MKVELAYFVPEPDGVTVVMLVDGEPQRVKWDKEMALGKCHELLTYIMEIRE